MENFIDAGVLFLGSCITLGAGFFSVKTLGRLSTAKKIFEILKDAVEFWDDERVQEAFKDHFKEDSKIIKDLIKK